jgi:AGZA family xanthine/uracil permease-like MFS transporter
MAATVLKWLGFNKAETSVPRELRAGLTTFMAMAYILFINPKILAPAFVIPGAENIQTQLLSATAIAAAFGSILMGFLARMPIALAPGMGLNAYFTYTVVLGHGLSWQTALGAVFVSGVVFLILTLSGLREAVIQAIPLSIKRASSAGIGMFLALIGLQAAGVVVHNPATMIGLGTMHSAGVLLSLFGLVLTAALLLRRVAGAILIGMTVVSLVAISFGLPVYEGKEFVGFTNGILQMPVWPVDLIGALDVRSAMDLNHLGIVFTFLFVAFFDTAGTLLGLTEVAKFSDQEGHIPRASQAFATDAVATVFGAMMGTSTTTAYMESAAGVEDGGKSGLVAVTTGILFLLALFMWPLASAVPAVATAPALIIVGSMLMESVGRIDWKDLRQALPAFLTMVGMPLTFSIASGISLGILSYVLISALSNKARDVHPVMYGLAVVLLTRFFWA